MTRRNLKIWMLCADIFYMAMVTVAGSINLFLLIFSRMAG